MRYKLFWTKSLEIVLTGQIELSLSALINVYSFPQDPTGHDYIALLFASLLMALYAALILLTFFLLYKYWDCEYEEEADKDKYSAITREINLSRRLSLT